MHSSYISYALRKEAREDPVGEPVHLVNRQVTQRAIERIGLLIAGCTEQERGRNGSLNDHEEILDVLLRWLFERSVHNGVITVDSETQFSVSTRLSPDGIHPPILAALPDHNALRVMCLLRTGARGISDALEILGDGLGTRKRCRGVGGLVPQVHHAAAEVARLEAPVLEN